MYSDAPQQLFDDYQRQGATWLHLVDLDGAKDSKNRQLKCIKDLIKNTTANIQIGGGVRTQKDVQSLLDAGAARVVIGSIAVKEPLLVATWLQLYGPEKIVLALDINIDKQGNKKVAIQGWQQQSQQSIASLLDIYLPLGLRHVLCTDISKDGTLKGSNISLYQELSLAYPQIQWQASGGIGDLDDISAVANSGATAVIIGRALLENKFNVSEAMQCW